MGKTKKPVKYAVVDAFSETEFKGNPAAVCLLEEEEEEEERDEDWLQSVAAEFNISETCYLSRFSDESVSVHPRFHLRWFTPVAEVELCGHATLAAAHFCFSSGLVTGNTVEFSTLSGILTAKKVPKEVGLVKSDSNDVEQPFLIELDFPAISANDCPVSETSSISQVLSSASFTEFKKTASDDYFAVLPSADAVTAYQPNLEEIKQLPGRGLIISAVASPESGFDFFSRFFCPKFGINEDPVCGSAHCALASYWSKKLGKCDFVAYAASPRSGIVRLHLDEQNNRVKLQGQAVTVMEGSIMV